MRYYSTPLDNLSKTNYYGQLLPTMMLKLDNRVYEQEELDNIKNLLISELGEAFIVNLFQYKSIIIQWKVKQDVQAIFKFRDIHDIIKSNKLFITCVVNANYDICTGILASCPSMDYKIEKYGSITDMTLSDRVGEYFL